MVGVKVKVLENKSFTELTEILNVEKKILKNFSGKYVLMNNGNLKSDASYCRMLNEGEIPDCEELNIYLVPVEDRYLS